MIRIEISSDHGIEVHDVIAVPMVGDYLRVSLSDYSADAPSEQREQEARDGRHGDDRAERVRYVVWHFEPTVVTVDTDCVVALRERRLRRCAS